MSPQLSDLTRRLAENAEAVCHHHLSNGRRCGNYWIVGDVRNSPGRSMFVRLNRHRFGKSAPGKWTDAATGEHGDLLDLIRESCGLLDFHDVVAEARRFLSFPEAILVASAKKVTPYAPVGSPESARRLFAISTPILGTIAETYLRKRGIISLPEVGALRFHPRCYYRPDANETTETWPALIAAVTDLAGTITGAHRTWLDPLGNKAPVETPRRAMGHLAGHGVRFGVPTDIMAAGEGLETVLSLRSVLPPLPVLAALSAHHLAVILLPATLRRLYVARDRDPAGDLAVRTLTKRAQSTGIEVVTLSPVFGDFNEDLQQLGLDELRAALRVQLVPEDVVRWQEGARS
jgi:Toprim domain